MIKIAIITINQPSLDSASKLQEYLRDDYRIDIYGKDGLKHNLDNLHIYKKLDDILPSAWKSYDAIIAILAIGAVVRKIAPFLKDKVSDPAIIVINLALDRVIPLVGGHLAGANELANVISKRVPNCINFISTATDQTNTLAFEMLAKKRGWRVENIKALAKISNRLINKHRVKVATYPNIFKSIPNRDNLELIDFSSLDLETVLISPTIKSSILTLRPKIYLGIGCNRNTPLEMIEKAVNLFLNKYNLNIDDIAKVASFEAKRDEVGVLEFAKKHNLKIEFFNQESINSLKNDFSDSASTKFFGIKGVAEPSAILASEYEELIIKKEVYFKSITLAGAV